MQRDVAVSQGLRGKRIFVAVFEGGYITQHPTAACNCSAVSIFARNPATMGSDGRNNKGAQGRSTSECLDQAWSPMKRRLCCRLPGS